MGKKRKQNVLTGEKAYGVVKWMNVHKKHKRLSMTELLMFQKAAEIYKEKMDSFEAAKVVKGKGKNAVITVKPHQGQPSFDKIYKEVVANFEKVKTKKSPKNKKVAATT